MNLTDLYLLIGFSLPAPDLLPDFQAYEVAFTVNYDRFDDARPDRELPQSDDLGTEVTFFK